jgi:hypothetical protein
VESETEVAGVRKHFRAAIKPGGLEVEEDAHELGWDVALLRGSLAEIGISLAFAEIRPCDCEVCTP